MSTHLELPSGSWDAQANLGVDGTAAEFNALFLFIDEDKSGCQALCQLGNPALHIALSRSAPDKLWTHALNASVRLSGMINFGELRAALPKLQAAFCEWNNFL